MGRAARAATRRATGSGLNMLAARIAFGGAAVVATAAAATLAPLWTYALSLALFGLPHVLTGLRYVDQRFGARLPRTTVRWLALGLLGIVLLRLLSLGDLGTAPVRAISELLVGGALVAFALPLLLPRGGSPIAITLVACLVVGALCAPIATLVILALLHNLTPVGFLAERVRGAQRRRALLACAIVFGVVPLLIVGGAFGGLFDALALHATDSGPFTSGELDLHLPAFVPPALLTSPFAIDLFAAAAYLQCMHYAVVLHVLPKLSGGAEAPGAVIGWPRPAVFAVVVALAGITFTVSFADDFAGTRSVYAVFAALHAWLELPILALACGLPPQNTTAPGFAR